jgi:putative hydrolase of the HAD superfamily
LPIRALLFDLDDTLLQTHGPHAAAIQACCALAAGRYPEWDSASLHGAFYRALALIEAQLETGQLQVSSQLLFRTMVWEEALATCGLSATLGRELAELYLAERRRSYALFDEVPAALDRLRERYRLVLVTYGLSDLQREKAEAVGIGRWFPHVVVSGEVGSWKPHSGIFHHALSLAECGPDAAVMIGDNLERDVRGAAAVGIRSVWMCRYPHLKPIPGLEPDARAGDMHELERLLAAWD